MLIPDKIDLKAVAPKGIIKLTLEKPYPNGFHTLIAKKDNAREETEFIRLMNFEVEELISKVWGRGSIVQKRAIMKNYLLSLGCTPWIKKQTAGQNLKLQTNIFQQFLSL